MIKLMHARPCPSSLPRRMYHNPALPLYFQTLNKIADLKTLVRASPLDFCGPSTLISNSRIWRTLETGESWGREMQPYQNAISEIVEETTRRYNAKPESMLEIGSGRYPITHFLPNMENKHHIHLSEFNVKCLHLLKKGYPQNTIRQMNILSPNQTNINYQTVVMSDVFNCFSKDEMGDALRGVNKLLKPGGRLFHFSMREPVFIEALDNLKEAEVTYLPVVDKYNSWIGAYVVNPEKLAEFIRAFKVDLIRDVLIDYISLDSLLQDKFCLENLGKRDLQIFFDLSPLIEQYDGLVEQKILFEDKYRQDLKEKLKEKNFLILEFKEREGNYSGPFCKERHGDLDANAFFTKQMTRLHFIEKNIPPGQIKERAIVHVLVAQKPNRTG